MSNRVGWDISLHTRDTETWRGIPAYASANTSTNGVANYNDGTYVLMPIRIHMHKGRHGVVSELLLFSIMLPSFTSPSPKMHTRSPASSTAPSRWAMTLSLSIL